MILNKKMRDKFYRGQVIILSMVYFAISIPLIGQVRTLAVYVPLLIINSVLFNYYGTHKITWEGFRESLILTKSWMYLLIAIGTLLQITHLYLLENKYEIISIFVIMVSLLEAITGITGVKLGKQ